MGTLPPPLTPDVVRASGESMTASFSAPRRAPRTLRSTGHLPSPARSRSVSRETAPVLRCIHPVHHLGHARGRVPQAQLGSIRDEGAHPRPMLGAERTEFAERERAPDDVASPTHGRHSAPCLTCVERPCLEYPARATLETRDHGTSATAAAGDTIAHPAARPIAGPAPLID